MTEEDWLWSSNPDPMLRFVEGLMDDRKLRLFGVACCRRYREEGEEIGAELAKLLDNAELLADGRHQSERDPLWLKIYEQQLDARRESDFALACLHVAFAGRNRHFFRDAKGEVGTVRDWIREASRLLIERPRHEESRSNRYFRESERLEQADIVREMVGNPFQEIRFEPAWRTSTVVEVARAIYEEKAFERLPILADALEDASCDEPALIEHLRSEREHFKGCWALDTVLASGAA